ncbi:MAG: ABC transporter ATP-binding protein [Myxococcales bacterium]|nr:ABC transporter ATP-binding protein [Myxococcales bacterium]
MSEAKSDAVERDGAATPTAEQDAPRESVIRFESVKKTFRIPILHTFNPKDWKSRGYRTKVEAVKEVSMEVYRGEIFGFLGPNGAGKSTSIKMLTGLVRPSSGRISIFGQPVWDVPASASPLARWFNRYRAGGALDRMGYLPEHPYFYDFLRPTEILEFFARLHGVPKARRSHRIEELIELVGLGHARERVLRKFSKGMLQRIGIAACLINDPELIVLDEPLSGLDPIGRKELRDLIYTLKKRGKTIFFSSHILHDIELICDRVAFIVEGQIREIGTLSQLQSRDNPLVEVLVHGSTADFLEATRGLAKSVESIGQMTQCIVEEPAVEQVLRAAFDQKLRIASVIPRKATLEEIFVAEAKRKEAS